ncbi:MAG: FAD-binding oxidoreductase [Deltaproteobacteria bacterium]|nr:FAD-binding oxidoreductase [Deltaproteobacteria bacterium]
MGAAVVRDLADKLSSDQVSVRAIDRRHVATDQWPAALLAYRQHAPLDLPICVVSPESAADVQAIVAIAIKHKIGIVPYGTGSGVVGGAWAEPDAITVDFKRMRKVLSIDRDRLVCEAEGGIVGIHLENHLRRHGLTLGHFPSSIICSSLGGWLVGRSAGQFSCRYGKIEDMVLSLRAVDGKGELCTFASDPLPKPGADDLQLVVGSEGTLALVTDARLRVWPKPEAEHYWGFEVNGVAHGLEVMRTLLRAGYAPTVLRLYDEFDSRVAKRKADGSEEDPDALSSQVERIARDLPVPERRGLLMQLKSALKRRSLAVALLNPSAMRFAIDRLPEKCTLIIGCEGSERLSQAMMEGMRQHCTRQGASDLGKGPGVAWYHGRYHVSYKQSPVFMLGAYVDTMEVSAPWPKVVALYDAVRDALKDRAFVMAHFSHAYLDGCALYFTFASMAPQNAGQDELAHYKETWQRALEAVTTHGGAVSHHHGVGLAKRAFLSAHHGPLWERFSDVKARFDPHGLLNRGKW